MELHARPIGESANCKDFVCCWRTKGFSNAQVASQKELMKEQAERMQAQEVRLHRQRIVSCCSSEVTITKFAIKPLMSNQS